MESNFQKSIVNGTVGSAQSTVAEEGRARHRQGYRQGDTRPFCYTADKEYVVFREAMF